MDPKIVFFVFLAAGAAYTLVWAWIVNSSKKQVEYSTLTEKVSKIRRRLLYFLLLGIVIVFLVSLLYLPYEPIQASLVGAPQATVNVIGSMFVWNLSRGQVPSGVPVEFDVTSIDVNHGFALYTPEGTIFAQVQAMPGYTNKLVVVFPRPGRYFIHCIEYCGIDHFAMESFIDVT